VVFLSLEHGTTFETVLWLKVEVEARTVAGTGPTAGHLERTAGNGRDEAHFHQPGGAINDRFKLNQNQDKIIRRNAR